MAYYLTKERDEDIAGSYRRYQSYLRNHQDKFPPGAFALGSAEWWQNPGDRRCPHDGHLDSFTIEEVQGEDGDKRITIMRLRLLNAQGDGYIELNYPRIFSHNIHSPSCEHGPGDWRYDEFTLSAAGHVVHEIEWAGFSNREGPRWIIEASDIEFQWIPKP